MKDLSKNFEELLAHLFDFKPVKKYSDDIWHFYTPSSRHKRKWLIQNFTKYQDTIYWMIHSDTQMEFDLKKRELKTGERSFHSTENHDVSAVIQSCIQTGNGPDGPCVSSKKDAVSLVSCQRYPTQGGGTGQYRHCPGIPFTSSCQSAF